MSSESNGEQIFVVFCCTVGFICLGVGVYIIFGWGGTMIYCGVLAIALACAPAREAKKKAKQVTQKAEIKH